MTDERPISIPNIILAKAYMQAEAGNNIDAAWVTAHRMRTRLPLNETQQELADKIMACVASHRKERFLNGG